MGKKSKIIMGLATAAMIPAILTGCGHKEHDPKDEWKNDATHHWHECEGKKCEEKLDKAEHEATGTWVTTATHHYKDCECGYDMAYATHTYDQQTATSDYLKTAATATTKAVYHKSCICGKAGTETFEADKTTATITNFVMSGKTYDGTAVTAPSYNKNTDGIVKIEYKEKNASDTTYTTTAPINAGDYTVRLSIPETETYTNLTKTQDFTISPKVIEFPEIIIKEYDGKADVEYTFEENDLGEVVTMTFTALEDSSEVKTIGAYFGIDCGPIRFYVNEKETENYDFSAEWMGQTENVNLFIADTTELKFTTDDVGEETNQIKMDAYPNGGLFKLTVKGGTYEVHFSDNFGSVAGIYNENGDEVSLDSTLTRGVYYLEIGINSAPTNLDYISVRKTSNEIKMLQELNITASDLYDAVNGVVVTLTEADGIYAGDEVTITIDVSYIDESYWTTGAVFGLTDSEADSGNGVLVATLGGADKDNYMIHWAGVTVTVACEPDMRGICTGCDKYLGTTTYSVNEWIMGLDIAAGETIYLRFELDTEGNPMYNFKFQAASGSNYLIMPGNLNINVYLDPQSAAGDNTINMNLEAQEFPTSQYMYIVMTATNHGIYNIMIEETF